MDRHRKQLEVVLKPEAKPRGEVLPSDVQEVIIIKEEQQEWSSSVDQEDPEPPHIKEEEEELWSSQEGEQLQGLEEADITKFTFTPVPVKSEDDEETPQSEGHHCGGPAPGPAPDRSSGPNRYLGPVSEDESLDSDVRYGNWEESRERQSGSTTLTTDDVIVSDNNRNSAERSFTCSECGRGFTRKLTLKKHMRTHTGEKPFSCSFCQKKFSSKCSSIRHMRVHTGEKPFSCSICKRTFKSGGEANKHMKTHMRKETSNTSDITSRRGGNKEAKTKATKSRSGTRS